MKILIVEQEDLARRTLATELSGFSFVDSTLAVSAEQDAEEILSRCAPQVVFLDMQLPDSGAFRIISRTWAGGVPIIVGTTTFDRKLLEALSRHRVEYLVRPFSTDELVYVLTRGRRSNPINPVENLEHLLDAAIFLEVPVRGRIRGALHSRSVILKTADIAAIRYDRSRFYLWTGGGILETSLPMEDVAKAVDFSGFRPVFTNSLISTDRQRFGKQLDQAKRWLRWHLLPDLFLNRRSGSLVNSPLRWDGSAGRN